MGFCYYLNTVHDYAMIHADECSFAGGGEGIHGVEPGESEAGDWEKGFASYSAAYAHAKEAVKGFSLPGDESYDTAEIRNCKHCAPAGGGKLAARVRSSSRVTSGGPVPYGR